MDPCEAEALIRVNATLSYNEFSSKANTLIDTAASLNFVSKDFLWLMVCTKIEKLLLSYIFERLVSIISLGLMCFVRQSLPFMDMSLMS